jgi:hypothetical protein
MTITTVPSTYKNGFFKRTATGILPYGNCGNYSIQTLTWEDLTDMLLMVRDDTTTPTPISGLVGFDANYLAYLDAVASNSEYTNYLAAMDQIMTETAAKLMSCSAFGTVQYYLLNTADIIRSSSDSALIGTVETGVCTENIVAQMNIDTVANCARQSSQLVDSNGGLVLCYYAAVSMGSYETNSEYPTHTIKIVASYSESVSTKKVLEFKYNQKTSGSSVVTMTGTYTSPGSGSFKDYQGYHVLYDSADNQIGNLTFSSQNNNILTDDAGFYVTLTGTYFITIQGTITFIYSYLSDSDSSSLPSGIQTFEIYGGTGDFLNAVGTITVDADNVTGDREVVVSYKISS